MVEPRFEKLIEEIHKNGSKDRLVKAFHSATNLLQLISKAKRLGFDIRYIRRDREFVLNSQTYVLNTPILTDYGVYKFSKISIKEAKNFLKEGDFTSVVGHQATAEFMSELLEIPVPFNRIPIKMVAGDKAIVFRMLDRLPEGQVLADLSAIRYEIGFLDKKSN